MLCWCRLGRNPSGQLQDRITEEQQVLCWYMTSPGINLLSMTELSLKSQWDFLLGVAPL